MRTRTEQATSAVPAVDTGIDLPASLGFLAGAVSKRMTALLNASLAEHGLTTTQWAVLARLWHEDGLTQRELSTRTGIDPATLTEMLKRMATAGRITRHRDENNQRFQRVYLADADKTMQSSIAASAHSINERATAGLTAAERQNLIDLLNRVLTNLDQTPAEHLATPTTTATTPRPSTNRKGNRP